MNRQIGWFGILSVCLGLLFLYIPIIVVVIYSFNASRLVTVWAGFSTKWYGALLQNQAYWEAGWITLKVALLSSTLATILGVASACIMVRIGRFPGRTIFTGLMFAPMILPEVITGLALLLMFIALDVDRGVTTVVIAHTTLSICYVCVVVSARLSEFDPSLEEAAKDLGCSSLTAFLLVTLPNIIPAVIAGFLLAFTMSLDSLVISSFTTGPGATTLPMRLYSEVRLGVSPEINALSTLIIAVVTFGTIVFSVLSKTTIRRRLREEQAAATAG